MLNPKAMTITDEVLEELDRRLSAGVKANRFSAVEDVWARNLRRVLAKLREKGDGTPEGGPDGG
jgi:hypothetical protein